MIKGLKTAVAVLAAAFMALFVISGPASAGNPKADGGQYETAAEHEGDGDTPDDRNDHPSGKDRSVEKGGSGTQGKSTSEPDDDGKGPERDTVNGESTYGDTSDDNGSETGEADKPGGTGGVDADRDGNNGCGNDDDFNDDNEGWCGKPAEAEETPEQPGGVGGTETENCPAGQKMNDENECVCVAGEMENGSCVLAEQTEKPAEQPEPCVEDGTMTNGNECDKTAVEGTTTVKQATQVKGDLAERIPVTGAEVLGVSFDRPAAAAETPAAAVLGTQFTRSGAAALARTGIGVVTLVALGLGLVTLGALASRKRNA